MPRNGSKQRQVAVMVTLDDYQRLQERFAVSTCPTLSAYCREIMLSHPVTVRYHNAASDEFLIVALELKRELDDALRNLREVLPTQDPHLAFRLADLISKVDELKLVMNQIYQQWSST